MTEFARTKPDRRRLLNSAPVYVWQTGDVALDRQFVQVFRQAWSLIPFSGRRRILRHWRKGHHRDLVSVCPDINLAPDWFGRHDGALGACGCAGHRLVYHSAAITLIPYEPLVGLILHELAHVACFAVGSSGHTWPGPDLELVEDGAVHTLFEWGLLDYDDGLSEWTRIHSDLWIMTAGNRAE